MSQVILHHVPLSRSFRILWLLEEMGITYDLKTYSIRDGSLRAPAFLEISPSGRVPALEIDGMTQFESAAIIEYLCESRDGFCVGETAQERLRFREWMGFAETQGSILTTLNLQHLFIRPPAKVSADVLKVETARLKKTLAMMEEALTERDYLLGAFSAVDCMFGWNLRAAPFYVDLAEFKALEAYLDRIHARPAYLRAVANDGDQDFYEKPFYAAKDVT
ncbi:MAG: glutathione S-transferase family protein [Halocynthiibacter sp.]